MVKGLVWKTWMAEDGVLRQALYVYCFFPGSRHPPARNLLVQFEGGHVNSYSGMGWSRVIKIEGKTDL
jgi:hypothetical protein